MATEKNFEFTLGNTWEIDFELNDAAGEDLDVTGGEVEFILALDGEIVVRLSSADDEVDLDSPAGGIGSVAVTPEDQSGLAPACYNYEVFVTLFDQRTTTQAFGKITALAGLAAWPPTESE
jgi:hypothetical protein